MNLLSRLRALLRPPSPAPAEPDPAALAAHADFWRETGREWAMRFAAEADLARIARVYETARELDPDAYEAAVLNALRIIWDGGFRSDTDRIDWDFMPSTPAASLVSFVEGAAACARDRRPPA
jgi:hypothetical protein